MPPIDQNAYCWAEVHFRLDSEPNVHIALGGQPGNRIPGQSLIRWSDAASPGDSAWEVRGYSSMAGYDPRGLVTFFQKLQAKEGKTSQVMAWLSDHPATPDRITHINQFIAEHHLTGHDLGAERLAPIKLRLASAR